VKKPLFLLLTVVDGGNLEYDDALQFAQLKCPVYCPCQCWIFETRTSGNTQAQL